MEQRITECEIGPIHHRPGTALLQPRECRKGHVAPWYATQGACAVCAKLHAYAGFERRGQMPKRRPGMRKFRSYAAARECHLEIGGYLLILESGWYACGDDLGAVEGLRGRRWMRRCDRIQCWDEVELRAMASGGGNAD